MVTSRFGCRIQRQHIIGFAILALLLNTEPGEALPLEDDPEPDTTFTLYWENDSFTGTDRDYTNGFKLTWAKPYTRAQEASGGLTSWMIDHLPFINDPEAHRGTSLSVGQNIYTPENTQAADLIEDERPYAGFSYIGFGFLSRKGRRRDVWEIDIGVVGPWSHAESVQNFVHDLLDVGRANGWDNQLDNELGLEVICESKWRLWQSPQWHHMGADIIPHLGGRMGNISIYANTGMELRIGWYVPKDFGTCPIRPGCDIGDADTGVADGYEQSKYGIHFFTSVDGRFVIRDIFLDGNTFQESHRVEKKWFVADLMAGIAVRFGAVQLSYAYILRTKEYEEQDKDHPFGAFNLSYTF